MEVGKFVLCLLDFVEFSYFVFVGFFLLGFVCLRYIVISFCGLFLFVDYEY